MVGPVSSEERSSFAWKLKVGLTLVVGLSTALIAVHGEASPTFVMAAGAVGLVVGAVLVWFLFRITRGILPDRADRERQFR